jgi:crotonobetainyl-CoA:carnitine CoA-transferase CaiB-like acyl-CoA transferase
LAAGQPVLEERPDARLLDADETRVPDQQWTRFVQEFGLQALAADPRLATNATRAAERPWLIPALQEVIATLPQDVVAERCERAAVSWSPVGKPTDLFQDAHLIATGGLLDVFVSRLGGENGPKVGLPALPVEFGAGAERARPGLERQPPRLGEHNAEILAAAGFTAAEIAALAAAGVIIAAA